MQGRERSISRPGTVEMLVQLQPLQSGHSESSDGGEALGVSALTPKGLDSGSRPTSPPSAGEFCEANGSQNVTFCSALRTEVATFREIRNVSISLQRSVSRLSTFANPGMASGGTWAVY